MFSRMGSAAFKKDLTNIILLCQHLGNPHETFKTIHVGGTNGKGSVSHMLAAVFQKAGYKTGLYTSPHLYDFRERIRINGEMISEEFVVSFVDRIKPQIETIEPSFFEITVGMAFEAFAENNVDIAIIEVGLGGRLDSTNIITPELSVITNIGWDHMNMLGNSLEEIAFEKAGIIKKNVPVVIGERRPETREVFEKKASSCSSPIFFAEKIYQPLKQSIFPSYLEVTYQHQSGEEITIHSDLQGIYQVPNIRTVLTAIDQLRKLGYQLSPETVSSALANVKQTTSLMGRWQVIQDQPTIVLEVAHNKDGVEQMLRHLSETHYQNLHLVIGMVRDKEIQQILSLLPQSASYYFTQANIPRALPSSELHALAFNMGLSGQTYENVNEALKSAVSNATKEDMIVVCGSIFLVAEVDVKRFQGREQL